MGSKPILISIEGNIGAGKSTIIDNLKQYMKGNTDVIFLKEPVDIWESIQEKETGDNILQKFYNNPTQYAFSFQVMAYITRLSTIRTAIRENPDCKVIICERSLDADKNIFAKMLYEDKKIEDINYQIYLNFYNEYKNDYKLDGIVYEQKSHNNSDSDKKKESDASDAAKNSIENNPYTPISSVGASVFIKGAEKEKYSKIVEKHMS